MDEATKNLKRMRRLLRQNHRELLILEAWRLEDSDEYVKLMGKRAAMLREYFAARGPARPKISARLSGFPSL